MRKSAFLSEPLSAAVTSARVGLIGMRRPTPYLPGPLVTSQTSTLCLLM